MILDEVFKLALYADAQVSSDKAVTAVHEQVFACPVRQASTVDKSEQRVAEVAHLNLLSAEEGCGNVSLCLSVHREDDALVLPIGLGATLLEGVYACAEMLHPAAVRYGEGMRRRVTVFDVLLLLVLKADRKARQRC